MSRSKEQPSPRQPIRDEGAVTIPGALFKGSKPDTGGKIGRRAFLGLVGAGAIGGAAVVLGPKNFGNPSQGAPSDNSGAETTITNQGTTEVSAPTTTLEPKPTDVIEHREGYDVLRNGGLLTKVESINVEGVEIDTSWFGGFETHLESRGVTYGMRQEEQFGAIPKELLLTNLLRSFGNQHVEFVKADGQVDIQAYVKYLEANNWTDPEAFVPKNITVRQEDPRKKDNPTAVVQSDPLILDLNKSFIISNAPLSLIEGFNSENLEFFKPTIADDANSSFGITNEGQLYYSTFRITIGGATEELIMKHPYADYPIADKLGFFLQLASRITYPEATPEDLWSDTFKFYNDPNMIIKSGEIAPYPVMSIFDFIAYDANGTINRLFVPV